MGRLLGRVESAFENVFSWVLCNMDFLNEFLGDVNGGYGVKLVSGFLGVGLKFGKHV